MVIYFHHYSNPSHSFSNGSCCDLDSCSVDCNSSLFLCVRLGETDHDFFIGCPLSTFLGRVGGDNVTFADVVGDVPNPVVLLVSILRDVRISYF